MSFRVWNLERVYEIILYFFFTMQDMYRLGWEWIRFPSPIGFLILSLT